MDELISKKELYEKVCTWEAQALHMCEVTMNDEDNADWKRWSAILHERSAFKFDVADAPAVDAVEVVRCKDCKYFNPNIMECEGIGKWFGFEDMWSGNDYCSKGERREDDNM